MTVCLLASMLCLSTFAALLGTLDAIPVSGVVLRVSGQKRDGSVVGIANGDFKDFAEGWEAAVDFSEDHDYMDKNGFDRIVVDLLADWYANKEGEFGESWEFGTDWGDGFQYSTIYVPSNTKITINLNGHTIDRDLKVNEYDGEVIFVDSEAELIINGGKSGDPITRGDDAKATVQFGTITGGWSDNGAGGIHINGAYVELNNVKVVGNTTDYDDGAGIAAYSSTLVIKGGSLNDNIIDSVYPSIFCCGGGIYAEESTVTLEKVEIKNNQTADSWSSGLGVYAEECNVTIDQCIFDGNGVGDTSGDTYFPGYSTIYANDSEVIITKSDFINNGSPDGTGLGDSNIIEIDTDTYIEMDECTFQNNAAKFLFDMDGTGRPTNSFLIKNSTFTDNKSSVLAQSNFATSCFEKCTFNNNEYPNDSLFDFSLYSDNKLIFRDCSMGDSTYPDHQMDQIEFQDANGFVSARAASIFSEGSLTMIVAFVALIASVASIIVNLSSSKKKLLPQLARKKNN